MISPIKTCPSCGRTYSDISFSFCLEDGSLLSTPFDDTGKGDDSEVETVVRSEIETVIRPPQVFSVPKKSRNVADSSGGVRLAKITEPVILITVNRLYKPDISSELLYEITRGVWRIGERRNKARFGFAVYKGIIREVYEIHSWHPAPYGDSAERKQWMREKGMTIEEVTQLRWQFEGTVSEELQHYIGCSTANYQVQGAQNPIKYVNC